MAWSKLKNIIILILLLFNLFLLVLIAGQQMRTARYEADTLSQTVEALALNGIAVGEDALPGNMTLAPLTVLHDSTTEPSVARILLDNEDIISARSGALNIYSSVSGNLNFRSSGEFSATLSAPWTGFDSMEGHTAALLEQLSLSVWSTTVSLSDYTVTAIPSLDGAPIFNAPVILTYNESVLLSMAGYLPGQAAPDSGQTAITVPTALIAVLEYVLEHGTVCRSIDRMTPGYTAAASLSDSVRLTPCWLVETDTANYYVDALTGAVTPVS